MLFTCILFQSSIRALQLVREFVGFLKFLNGIALITSDSERNNRDVELTCLKIISDTVYFITGCGHCAWS